MVETTFVLRIAAVKIHQFSGNLQGSGTGDNSVAGGTAADDPTGRTGGKGSQGAFNKSFRIDDSGSLDGEIFIGSAHNVAACIVDSAQSSEGSCSGECPFKGDRSLTINFAVENNCT